MAGLVVPEERAVTPNLTKETLLAGYRYSLWKDIKGRGLYIWLRIRWRVRWCVATLYYGDRFLGFSGDRPSLKKREKWR